ncbi:MAG: putative ABC transporter permease, partial [Traorella sp.]
VLLLFYLIIHPILYGFIEIIPNFILVTIDTILSILTLIDFMSVKYTLKTNIQLDKENHLKKQTNQIGQKIVDIIWSRLQKAYPGIDTNDNSEKNYTFADGIRFDKIVWIFLITSLLGALIEMVFCRLNGYPWMSRSSLLYGAFSVVWGLGAVLLTIILQPLIGKEDRYTFIAGFFIGGVYEYLCSVFTEIVFGTIFWDYSGIPLNIGGRVNVLFCVFWGVLAVLWVKILYPLLDKTIEMIPPIAGKIITWVVLIFMICDGLLTSSALIRYNERQTNPTSKNFYDDFLDNTYDDEWMANRWPNMKFTKK